MTRTLGAVIAAFVVTACATLPAPTETSLIAEAVGLQNAVIADPQFSEILQELDDAGAIEWGDDSLTSTATREAATYPSRVRWLLAQYASKGGFSAGSITVWRKWNPFSRTTAVTARGMGTTRLNRWRLASDPHDIATTLVHERVHGFGQGHAHGQYKAPNQCDAAYVAGDLAEAILTRSRPARTITEPNVCPALCEALHRRNLPASTLCA